MTSSLRHALVIGGGFSGMSAAIALARRDVRVDLVEVDPGWRSYGAGISLGGPTLRAFEALGILPQFLEHGFASDGLDLFTPNGQFIAQLPTPRAVGAGPQVPGGGAIMRPALARLMADATRRAGVHVRLGCSHTALSQDAEAVEVLFSDGTTGDKTGRYDLVVGADGLQSRLRGELFPDSPRPAYSGQGVWRAVLPRPPELQRVTMWMGGPVKPGVNPVSQDQMYLFVTENRPANDHVAPAEQPALLRTLLAPFSAPLLRAVRAQIDESAQVIYRPLSSLLLPAPWFKGRVVLIGDAVHATTPHLASGACIGIEDGLVLADEMSGAARGDGSIADGLQRFQQRRWERCRMVVESSNKLGEIEIAGGSKEEHGQVMRAAQQALAQPI